MDSSPAAVKQPVVRRFRPRWYLLIGFLVALVATPFVFSVITNWQLDRELAEIYREMDAEDPHWRWEDMIANQPPPLPDAENAALQFMKVRELLLKTPYTSPKTTFNMRFSNARLPAEDAVQLRKALERLPLNVIVEARKLKDMPRGQFRIEAGVRPREVKAPDATLLSPIRLLQDDALLRIHDQQVESAAESCLAMFNAERAIGDFPTLMAQLVRVAIEGTATNVIERALGQAEMSETTLHALQKALEQAAADDGMHAAFRGERIGLVDFYTQLREGKATVTEAFNGTPSMTLRGRMVDLFPGVVLRGYPSELRLLNEMVRAATLHDRQLLAAFEDIGARGAAVRSPFGYSPGYFIAGQPSGYAQDKARIRCAVIAVAAERFRHKNERWPKGMDEVRDAAFLTKMLNDPFDGQPLRWRQTTGGLVVYSIGQNGIDDSSKLNPDQTEVAGLDRGFVVWNRDRRAVEPVVIEKKKKK